MLANQFSDFFTAKVRDLCVNFSSNGKSSKLGTVDSGSFHLSSSLVFLSKPSESEIIKVIMQSPSKNSSTDVIPTWLLKSCLPQLLPAITLIINNALDYGMPKKYKHAHVIPLLKKSSLDQNILANYRPVSNLPFLAKVIEKLVASRLHEHLQSNQLLDPHQSAYRQFHSCETALVFIQSSIFSAMDSGNVSLLALIDLSAAFDSVHHKLLTNKLECCGITGQAINWFNDYLTERQQTVIIDKSSSHPTPLLTGVPQGSVLGPVLFSIYVRELGSVIQKHDVKYAMYADDLQLLVTCSPDNIGSAMQRLELCIVDVKQWYFDNHLVINCAKTEFIIFATRQKLLKLPPDLRLRVGDTLVAPSESVRNLGVLFDREMKMEKHVVKVCQTCFAQLRVIGRLGSSMDYHNRRNLVLAMVISRVNYCVALLYGASDKVLRKLQRVTNTCMKIIGRDRNVSVNVKADCALMSIKKRIYLRIAMLTYNAINLSVPSYLASMVHRPHPQAITGLRSSAQNQLPVSRTHTETGKRAFTLSSSHVWNSLPKNARTGVSYDVFRRIVIKHIIDCNDIL
jgi:hypothetical protein